MRITLAGRYNRPVDLARVVNLGWRAAHLLDGARSVRVLAPMRASIYIVIDGEIAWLAGPGDVMHPRAVLLSERPDPRGLVAGDSVSVPLSAVRPWHPPVLVRDRRAAAALRRGAERLTKTILTLGDPTGFGAWLAARPLAFPLSGAGKLADALASALAANDPVGAAESAAPLLGLGAGLTPSGDDFVGGAFFARATLAQLGEAHGVLWRRAAATVGRTASGATHPISEAILRDLLEGHGWSPLHELARALASDDESAAAEAASRLTRLGHSSGWDLLAGFVAGAAR